MLQRCICSNRDDRDIIIADMAGTGEDGFRLLEALRSRPDFSDISVIILTDADNPEREIRGLRLGAKDYLRLPLRIESLQARIDMHLELVEKHRIKQKAREQQMLFNAIFSQAPIGVSISHSKEPNGNPPGVPFMVNPMYERIMGRPRGCTSSVGLNRIPTIWRRMWNISGNCKPVNCPPIRWKSAFCAGWLLSGSTWSSLR